MAKGNTGLIVGVLAAGGVGAAVYFIMKGKEKGTAPAVTAYGVEAPDTPNALKEHLERKLAEGTIGEGAAKQALAQQQEQRELNEHVQRLKALVMSKQPEDVKEAARKELAELGITLKVRGV